MVSLILVTTMSQDKQNMDGLGSTSWLGIEDKVANERLRKETYGS
jgi:hypothetical protein